MTHYVWTMLGDMDGHFINQTLFPIIRAGMGIPEAPIPVDASELKTLKEIAHKQSILPIIWEGLQKQELKIAWQPDFEQAYFKNVYRYVIRDNCLKAIYDILEQAEVPYVPLKGAYLQLLYPEPWMRTSSDIDILIHEEDLDTAISKIVAGSDFKVDKRNYHDVSLINNQICLELHFSIKEDMSIIDRLLERVWEYSVKPVHGFCYELTPEFQVFHILSHMSYHMVNGGLGIRPFLDLWLLRSKTAFDESVVHSMCNTCGILKFYEISCQLTDVWMNHQTHTPLTAKLEDYCLSGGVFGSPDNGAKQRKYRGFSFIVHRLFAPRSTLEEMYPQLKKRPYLIFAYQVKRWLRLLDKKKRANARNELGQLKSTSSAKINAFDSLLTELGL